MSRLFNFWLLPWREKRFFCEAGIVFLFSHLSVRTIAFKHIDTFLRARGNDGNRVDCDAADDIELIRLSLARIVNLFRWKSVCLSRSIAQFIMLRRRGIPAVIYVGAKFSGESSLLAHAWVTTSAIHNGNSDNDGYTPLVIIGHESISAGSLE